MELKPDYIAESCVQSRFNKPVEQGGEYWNFEYNRPPYIEIDHALTPDLEHRYPVTPNGQEDDGWGLVWDEALREFHFHNSLTGAKKPVPRRDAESLPPPIDTVVKNSADDATAPSQSQIDEALEEALQQGHGRVVYQLVEYGMDLNIRLFGSRTTPLKWAAEHESLGLVRLFLDNGAIATGPDPTWGASHGGGPALIKAVENRNLAIAEALVQKTDRVASTRALGLAVDRRDSAMVGLLLANGVQCDFQATDRPHPRHSLDTGCYFSDISEPEEFIPPLVRAVKYGNLDMARLLLSHGADANVGYHDLNLGWNQTVKGRKHIEFSCGRAIQLAMELDRQEIVHLLLDHGAEIGRVHPVWPVPGHACRMVPRAEYQRVTAALRAAVAAREKRRRAPADGKS